VASERVVRWTRALGQWWLHYNAAYLDWALRRPVFRLTADRRQLGSWDRELWEIRISEAHIAADPWHEVMVTLRHEMAHQYVDQVLGAGDEPPHGPAFRTACRLLRIDPSAAARAPTPVRDEEDRLTRRVAKLLALGGSPNEHEAAAAMHKARELMIAHNLDGMLREDRHFTFRELGPVKKRHMAWENTLGALLNEFFFVEVIWSPTFDAAACRDGTALYVYGTPHSVDMAEYVHRYLTGVLEQLWLERRRDLAGRGGRMQFYDGVMQGFRDKLREQERARCSVPGALVWRGDPELDAFYRWHHPTVRTRSSGYRAYGAAWAAGRAAGREVTLRRPLGGSGGSTGLLGEGR